MIGNWQLSFFHFFHIYQVNEKCQEVRFGLEYHLKHSEFQIRFVTNDILKVIELQLKGRTRCLL